MNIHYRVKQNSGFTLLEVLIALVIFAVGILGVATMQISSIQGNSKGRQISEASSLAADRIEMFIDVDYVKWVDVGGDGTAGLDDVGANADDRADLDGDGQDDIFWNIAEDFPLPNTKTIRVIAVPRG